MKTFDGVGSDNTKVEWMKRTPVCYLVYVKRDENGWIVDKLMASLSTVHVDPVTCGSNLTESYRI